MKTERGEPVVVQSGFTIQWNQEAHCIIVFDQNKKKLLWSTNQDRRLVNFKNVGTFENMVRIIAELSNLNAIEVSDERHPTFRFE